MYDRGMFRDVNEFRQYVSKFDMEFEQLSDEELQLAQQALDEEGEEGEEGEEDELTEEEIELEIFEDVKTELESRV
jgi:hypothetical protein